MLQLKENFVKSKSPFSRVQCFLDCKTPVIAKEYKKKKGVKKSNCFETTQGVQLIQTNQVVKPVLPNKTKSPTKVKPFNEKQIVQL